MAVNQRLLLPQLYPGVLIVSVSVRSLCFVVVLCFLCLFPRFALNVECYLILWDTPLAEHKSFICSLAFANLWIEPSLTQHLNRDLSLLLEGSGLDKSIYHSVLVKVEQNLH